MWHAFKHAEEDMARHLERGRAGYSAGVDRAGRGPIAGCGSLPERLRTPVNLVTATSGGRFLDYV